MSLSASIIIPTRGNLVFLKRCLSTIVKQVARNDEIIVVENRAPSLEVKRLVKNLQEKLKFVQIRYTYEVKQGPSFARNKGISLARGKILVFLDDDCRPLKGWLKAIKKRHTQEIKEKKQQVFQGRIDFYYHERDFFSTIFYLKKQHHWKLVRKTIGWRVGKYLHSLSAGNFSVRKEILIKNKIVFNEYFFPFMLEERDLVAQFYLAGVPVIYNPEARVAHLKLKSSPQVFLQKFFELGKSQVIFNALYSRRNELKEKSKSHLYGKIQTMENFTKILPTLFWQQSFFVLFGLIWMGCALAMKNLGTIFGLIFCFFNKQKIAAYRFSLENSRPI